MSKLSNDEEPWIKSTKHSKHYTSNSSHNSNCISSEKDDDEIFQGFRNGEIVLQIHYKDGKIKGLVIENNDYEKRMLKYENYKLLWQSPFKTRLMFVYMCLDKEYYVTWRKRFDTNHAKRWFTYKPGTYNESVWQQEPKNISFD